MSILYKMDVWGSIYALFSRYASIAPAIMEEIVAAPSTFFSQYHKATLRYLSPDEITHLAILLCLLEEKDFTAERIPLEDQSPFWLTFYKDRGEYKKKKTNGRPRAGLGIDWSDVDWSQNNGEIARQKGCASETVRVRRKKVRKAEDQKNELFLKNPKSNPETC